MIKRNSNGVFPIRFMGYMNANANKAHQVAMLIYNKKDVKRSIALKSLSTIRIEQESRSGTQDRDDPTLAPILNFPNYAPYEGDPLKYNHTNLVSLNELRACIGMNCMDGDHGT